MIICEFINSMVTVDDRNYVQKYLLSWLEAYKSLNIEILNDILPYKS